MRILGIDYGEAHIGIAIGDTETNLALPFGELAATPRAELFAALERTTVAEHIDRIVVGMPNPLRPEPGSAPGASAVAADQFAHELETRLHIPVATVDERMTSVAANRLRHDNAAASEHALAAMLILETYLARYKP